MSPTRSRYRELGLELVSLDENCSRQPKPPPMEKEKRDEGEKDPIKLLLSKSLAQQRNEMLENFGQILQRLSTITYMSLLSSRFGDVLRSFLLPKFPSPFLFSQIIFSFSFPSSILTCFSLFFFPFYFPF
jgi:hypothetical protein